MDSESDGRYTFIPRQKPILDATAGRAHLLITELERWMDPRTLPEYSEPRLVNQAEDAQVVNGSIHISKRRQAAIQATRILNDIVIPDLNAYEKESSSRQKRKRDH